jgi:hypothetical protein
MSSRSTYVAFSLLVLLTPALAAQRPNLAVNAAATGVPSPLASDPGWGGGSYPWQIVDGQRTYSDTWAHGLAFTGGRGNWPNGVPAGPRQATIDLGAMRTFAKVTLWHHGHDHTPAMASTSQLAYWNGTAWVNIAALRTIGRIEAGGQGSTSDEYDFQPVTGSKVRWSFDNREASHSGPQIEHGWLYEFEVFLPEPSMAFNPRGAGMPSPLSSNRGWGGGSYPWEIVDGQRTYTNTWAHGLAFTGGDRNWGGEPAGPRQATIEFGRDLTFGKVILWHHGHDHTPALNALSQLAYWNGTSWTNIAHTRRFGRMEAGGQGATSDEYVFAPVRSSRVRWSFDNRDNSISGRQNVHGWLYEFEVFAISAQTVFGTGCSGAAGVPTIATANMGPRLSEPFTLELTNVAANAPVVGVLGFSNTSVRGAPLPLDLTPLGAPGCQLLVSDDLAVPIANRPTATTARWTTNIPYIPALLGVDLYQQAVSCDPTANPLGLSMSNGSRASIGWN